MGVTIQSIRRALLEEVQTPVHKIRNYLNREDFPLFSIAEIDRQHAYDISQSHEKQYFYYILEGEGVFLLNQEEIPLKKGDIFVVPPQSSFRTPVGVRLLAITTPRFQ